MNDSIFIQSNQPQDLELIDYLHKLYIKRLNFYGISGNDLNRFSWSQNKKISLYRINVANDLNENMPYSLVFATISPDNQNHLFKANLVNETYKPSFIKLYDAKEKLNWLVDNKIISQDLINKVILSSIKSFSTDLLESDFLSNTFKKQWMYGWFDNEYKTTLDTESHSTPINHFPKTNQKYFVDRYHFNDMLKTINNDQFTDEFNQCLFAYEHEKWFLCAAGLGSCIEHLMLIIIQNYDKKGYKLLKLLGKEPTARNYIACFRKEPIKISSRQERFFNSIFNLRNAVDHHNTGKTQRGICDLLLDATSDIFNDYYYNSVAIIPKSSQSKK